MTNGILLTQHNQEIAQWSPDPFPHERVGSGHDTTWKDTLLITVCSLHLVMCAYCFVPSLLYKHSWKDTMWYLSSVVLVYASCGAWLGLFKYVSLLCFTFQHFYLKKLVQGTSFLQSEIKTCLLNSVLFVSSGFYLPADDNGGTKHCDDWGEGEGDSLHCAVHLWDQRDVQRPSNHDCRPGKRVLGLG